MSIGKEREREREKSSLLFSGFAGGLGGGGVGGVLVFFFVVDELFLVTIVVSDFTHPTTTKQPNLGLGFWVKMRLPKFSKHIDSVNAHLSA